MTREELERRLDEAEKQNLGLLDEIKWLKEKLAEQDKQEIPDFPEFNCGDVVYEMDSCFDVMEKEHGGGKGDKDFTGNDAQFYNGFHTADYAHELRRKCLMIAMMLHCKWYLCRDYRPDFNNTWVEKWTVAFNYNEGKFWVEISRVREWSTIHFDTEENAQKCANWMNEHWKEV